MTCPLKSFILQTLAYTPYIENYSRYEFRVDAIRFRMAILVGVGTLILLVHGVIYKMTLGQSAPHALASELAKPLTQTLGSISDTHLKNTSDLIN